MESPAQSRMRGERSFLVGVFLDNVLKNRPAEFYYKPYLCLDRRSINSTNSIQELFPMSIANETEMTMQTCIHDGVAR
jgi:hypothetical protein